MSAQPWEMSALFRQAWQDGALSLEEASLLEDWEIVDMDPPPSLDEAVQRLYLWTLLVDSREQ
jgi:hypothetical protein